MGGGPLQWKLWYVRCVGIAATLACMAFVRPAAGNDIPGGGWQKADASDGFFRSTNVPHLRVEVAATELAELRKDHRTYVRATVREGDATYTDVALRLKGKLGSFRPVDDRPSVTLNFDKFKPGQRFHGLDKIHLNNSLQDPTCMTEILCAELFLAAGVPAARGMHARVEFDRRDLGVYVLKEGFDKTFLRRYFKNPDGNLYESGFMEDITEALHKNSSDGDVEDQADLDKVASVAELGKIDDLARVLDLDRFLSFLAMEVMICHWDGYAIRRNNYRVYHDPDADKVVFFPHGMDQVFGDPFMRLAPQIHGLVGKAVMDSPEGRQRYWLQIGVLLTNVFRVGTLTNRIDELRQRVRPVIASVNPDLARWHDMAVESLRQRVVQRAWYIEQQLHDPESVVLSFSEDGVARIPEWRPHPASGGILVEHAVADGNKPSLYIKAESEGMEVGSWRARVMLKAGQYRLEGQVRTAGLAVQSGAGAALRSSGTQPSTGPITMNTGWRRVSHEFEVRPETGATELVCEFRGAKGEVWFEEDSLRLVRKPPEHGRD